MKENVYRITSIGDIYSKIHNDYIVKYTVPEKIHSKPNDVFSVNPVNLSLDITGADLIKGNFTPVDTTQCKIVIHTPECKETIGVGIYSNYLFNNNNSTRVKDSEDFLLTDGISEIPYFVKNECEAVITLYLITPFTGSNLIGQYFGVIGVSFTVPLKPNCINEITIPHLTIDDFYRYYFTGDLMIITDKEIIWKDGKYKRVKKYPEQIEQFF